MTDPLDADRIAEGVLPALRSRLRRVTVRQTVDSTNTALAALPAAEQHAHALLAEEQTAGRGRGARRWHSPAGGNIYLSLGWRFRSAPPDLGALPLAVAVAVTEALTAAGLEGAGIKWPNDILVDGRKLAGILVESQLAGASEASVIAGIGLNVRMPRVAGEAAIDRPWTDLESDLPASRRPVKRNHLVSGLLDRLLATFERFEATGFKSFRPRYTNFDILKGRPITLEHASGEVSGTGRGVDESGRLLVDCKNGEVRAFHSGEVRVFGA